LHRRERAQPKTLLETWTDPLIKDYSKGGWITWGNISLVKAVSLIWNKA